jgi:hypothetical protein
MNYPLRSATSPQGRQRRVRLTRKLAVKLDGIDLSTYRTGDVIEVEQSDADLLVAEGWAVPVPNALGTELRTTASAAATADDASRRVRRTAAQLRHLRQQWENRQVEQQERRRAEDRIREELHDARARVISGRSAGKPSH